MFQLLNSENNLTSFNLLQTAGILLDSAARYTFPNVTEFNLGKKAVTQIRFLVLLDVLLNPISSWHFRLHENGQLLCDP